MNRPVYVITHNGLRIMKRFYMSKTVWFKGCVWITSVIDGQAFMSIHDTGDDSNKGGDHYRERFRFEHAVQIKELRDQSLREEEEKKAKEGVLIHDITAESKQIIKETSRLTAEDLKD